MASKLEGVTISKSEVSQSIDVSEILGVDVSDRPRVVQEFAQAMIDKIRERTKSGNDVDGKPLKGYDTDYVQSEDFKEFGKSKRDVNMTLKGDMLDSIDIAETSGSNVKVAIGSGVNTLKAYNHNVGDTLPVRKFWGVSAGDLEDIKSQFDTVISEIKTESTSAETLLSEATNLAAVLDVEEQSAFSLFDSIFGDEFGN